MGIGDWGPIPNPQSPIPNPHCRIHKKEFLFKNFNLFVI
jgi:hypothetical protein